MALISAPCPEEPAVAKEMVINSIFIGFAPKDNPRIAVAVIVENGGHGNSFAAPIGSLMIEKYLTGNTSRKHLEERMMNANLVKR